MSGVAKIILKTTGKLELKNNQTVNVVFSYFSPVCRSVIWIWSRNQPFIFPCPELSCQIRKNVSGPRQPSELIMKFMILPVVSSCTKNAFQTNGRRWNSNLATNTKIIM